MLSFPTIDHLSTVDAFIDVLASTIGFTYNKKKMAYSFSLNVPQKFSLPHYPYYQTAFSHRISLMRHLWRTMLYFNVLVP